MTPYEDFPLLMFFHIATAVAMYKLFFSVRRAPFPLPHIIGLLAVAITVCASARYGRKDWFYIPATVQYAVWFLSTLAAVFATSNAKTTAAKVPGAVVVIPDTLDKISNKIVWVIGLIAVGFFLVDSVRTYNEKKAAETAVTATAIKVYAAAQRDNAQVLKETQETQQTLVSAVTSISATQSTILAVQSKNYSLNQTNSKRLEKALKKTNAALDKTNQKSNFQNRPSTPDEIKKKPAAPKKWYQFFGKTPPFKEPDSMQIEPSPALTKFNPLTEKYFNVNRP